MQYSKKTILQALLLTPLPLLVLAALSFIIMNSEYSPYSIMVVFAGHGLVYVVYCVLTLPITFLFSWLLSYFHALNIFSIALFTLIIAGLFFLFLEWAHMGQLPQDWWKTYSNPFTLIMAIIPAVTYWLFLIKLKTRQA